MESCQNMRILGRAVGQVNGTKKALDAGLLVGRTSIFSENPANLIDVVVIVPGHVPGHRANRHKSAFRMNALALPPRLA